MASIARTRVVMRMVSLCRRSGTPCTPGGGYQGNARLALPDRRLSGQGCSEVEKSKCCSQRHDAVSQDSKAVGSRGEAALQPSGQFISHSTNAGLSCGREPRGKVGSGRKDGAPGVEVGGPGWENREAATFRSGAWRSSAPRPPGVFQSRAFGAGQFGPDGVESGGGGAEVPASPDMPSLGVVGAGFNGQFATRVGSVTSSFSRIARSMVAWFRRS